jgi:putative tricarboxylic transport membrane protein
VSTQLPAGGADPVGTAPPAQVPDDDDKLLPSHHEEGPRAGRGIRIAGAVVPLAFGVAALLLGLTLRFGSPQDPGPGLWPVVISVAIIVLSVVLLVTEREEHDYEKFTRGALLNLLGVVSLVAYVVMFQLIGFEIATLLITAFWLKVLGSESWRATVALSVAVTASLYILFVLVLEAPIPRLLVL